MHLINFIKNTFGYLIIIGLILFVLVLLMAGFESLFGGFAGCGIDLSC